MLLAAILLQAQAAVFAPPPGIPYRLVTERVQDDEAGHHGFRVERLVRFTRDGIGWRAEVRVVRAEADDAAEGARFQAGYSGLAKRTLVFRLDGAGKILSLDDHTAVWEDFLQGVARIAALKGKGDSADRSKRIADALRALPRPQQLAALAPLAEALIAPEAFDPPGTAAIRQPGASPLGGQVMLEGTRTVTAGPLTRAVTRAAAPDVETVTDRSADPATGLLAASSETAVIRVQGLPETRRTTTIRVEKLAASGWPE
jgi:hypothetical protein